MSRFFDWWRRRRFGSDVRFFQRFTGSPQSRLEILSGLNDHLRAVTFKRTLTSQDSALTLRSYAHNCDNLLLDLRFAVDALHNSEISYLNDFKYHRREQLAVRFADYLRSNSGLEVPTGLFAEKLIKLIIEFHTAISEHISLDSQFVQHHLRQTSRLVEEVISVQYLLLLSSDQKLAPPASEKSSR